MNRSKRLFFQSFFYSLVAAAAAACLVILTQVPSFEGGSSSQPQTSRLDYTPTSSDCFTLLCTLSREQGASPYAYFLLGFDGPDRSVTVTRLFPETVLSHEGEARIILKECFEAHGAGGACLALNNYFSTNIEKYIVFNNRSMLSFLELFDSVVMHVPQDLSQVDRKNDIYIKIDKGSQVFNGMLLLDYIGCSAWDGGASEALCESARAVCEFMRQNHTKFAFAEGNIPEQFLLGSTETNLSVTDIAQRRELLSYLFAENADAVSYLQINGSYGAQNTEFQLDAASVLKISARY